MTAPLTVSYEECEEWAQGQELIKSSWKWRQAYKNSTLPQGFPCNPELTFKDRGWRNWYIFLYGDKKDVLLTSRLIGIKKYINNQDVIKILFEDFLIPLNLSLTEIAKKMNLASSYFYTMRKKKEIGLVTEKKICKYLNLPDGYFYNLQKELENNATD